jgi:two-component system CheB/CheR fusion protein
VGRPLSDLTHELHYDELEADARRVLEQLVAVDREVAGSRNRWYLSRMLPYRTTARQVDGVVLTLIDITQRKRAEDELRLADRRKDEFLATLAHELRNPLAPIASGIEVLRKAGGDSQTVERLSGMMARQTQQLIRLVDDLLEVSRISGGKLRLHMEPARLMDIIQDAITAAKPLIDSLGHQLTVTTPEEPVTVNADAVRLTQVIANLLNNAARYTPPGGRIELAMKAQTGVATVTVKDDGVGIDKDAIAHVFDMFYQGNGARGLPNGGLGIGLALAKSLIEMHGGTITVASGGSQRGSEFKVNLPTTLAVPSSNAETTGRQASLVNRGRRVLIVDDNRDAAETLCTLIKALGDKDVHTASNGREALRKSAELHPQVILLDLLMPDMDGFEVARRIRKEPWGRDVTMVALTGWGSEEHRRRSREAGFDGHLTKPVDMGALRAVLADPGAAEQRLA